MKIRMVCIGKTGKSFLEEAEAYYTKRLKHYISFEKIQISDLKNAKKLSSEEIKEREGELILSKLAKNERVFLLDEKGKLFSSISFSAFMQQQFNQGGQCLTFVIGGPYGFSEGVYQRAEGKISLSKMTFSHQMIRPIFLEQLYRAMTILKGEPYHHQ